MPIIQLPEALCKYANGRSQLDISANSLPDMISWLRENAPELSQVLFTGDSLCGYVNMYLDGELVSHKIGQPIPINDDTKIDIVAAVSGG